MAFGFAFGTPENTIGIYPLASRMLLAFLAIASGIDEVPRWNSSPELQYEKITGPRAHERLAVSDLPPDFSWSSVNGTNYLTESRNQHIPTYCGACWAFGTLSSFNDRLKIAAKATYPDIILSPQVLINCHGGGSCNGGNVGGVMRYMDRNGLPDETCQNYMATNGIKCEPLGVCETCTPGGGCTKVDNPPLWTLASFGYVLSGEAHLDLHGAHVSDAEKLKAEIFANGPIACGIHATDEMEAFGTTTELDAYPGRIFFQKKATLAANHILSIVGWGTDVAHGEYWVLRNSWGTYW